MKIYIPYALWKAAEHCMAIEDVRYYLNGIHISDGKIESTNGHVAYQAKFKDLPIGPDDGEKWPDMIIKKLNSEPTKAIKKKTYTLRVTSTDDGLLIDYLTSNYERIHTQNAEAIDGKFPCLDRVKPKRSKVNGSFDVGFNAEYLSLPAKILEGEKFGHVKMTAYSGTSSCRIDIIRSGFRPDSEFILLMPVRL